MEIKSINIQAWALAALTVVPLPALPEVSYLQLWEIWPIIKLISSIPPAHWLALTSGSRPRLLSLAVTPKRANYARFPLPAILELIWSGPTLEPELSRDSANCQGYI